MDFLSKAREDFAAIIKYGEFSEPVIITTDSESAAINGIFDETYQENIPGTQAVIMSTKPRVTIWKEDVVFEIIAGTSRVTARNKTYRVRDIQPDGEGSVTLYLD